MANPFKKLARKLESTPEGRAMAVKTIGASDPAAARRLEQRYATEDLVTKRVQARSLRPGDLVSNVSSTCAPPPTEVFAVTRLTDCLIEVRWGRPGSPLTASADILGHRNTYTVTRKKEEPRG